MPVFTSSNGNCPRPFLGDRDTSETGSWQDTGFQGHLSFVLPNKGYKRFKDGVVTEDLYPYQSLVVQSSSLSSLGDSFSKKSSASMSFKLRGLAGSSAFSMALVGYCFADTFPRESKCSSGSEGSSFFVIRSRIQVRISSRCWLVFSESVCEASGTSPLRTSGGNKDMYFLVLG